MNIFASGLFTALNNGKISAVISVARTLVFECAAMLILPMFIGINGVWSALPVAELCAVAISVTFIIANAKNTIWSVYHCTPFVQTVCDIKNISCPSVAL